MTLEAGIDIQESFAELLHYLLQEKLLVWWMFRLEYNYLQFLCNQMEIEIYLSMISAGFWAWIWNKLSKLGE